MCCVIAMASIQINYLSLKVGKLTFVIGQKTKDFCDVPHNRHKRAIITYFSLVLSTQTERTLCY